MLSSKWRTRSVSPAGSSPVAASQSRAVLSDEAVFTRNAATVRRQIQEFDDEFHRLLKARNWSAANSRPEGVRYLREYLDVLENRTQP